MFVTTLFVQALLATAAFALPSSKERHEARVARRAGGLRQSLPRVSNETHPEYSSNWAGAVYNSAKGTYKSVTATFVVPTPKAPSGSSSRTEYSASAWVGIDGDTCGNAILQTGVDFNVEGGSVSYDAWYEWYPDYAYDFSGITFSPGDSVTLTVTAASTTSGTAVITNNSKGKTVTKQITSRSALCEQDAEWIVEDFEEGSSLVPFANFGTVTFTGASAKTASGSVGPGSANTIDIEQNNKVLTSVSTSSSSVTVSYV
ncbi:peptidase A4 family-domain-containing protein [Phanerochaete sordida]|uniref:Peptidase A4 family-domain-containing protein n=1 Tax=Phanerochaete sordida TaxID=48140 RepID=A0A9P3GST3_9APHY|nr:peptidase A4 family-domain-containing protein [Phanerochaete sordida]